MCDAMMRDVWPSADARLRSRPSYASIVFDHAPAIVYRVPKHQSRHGEHAHNLTKVEALVQRHLKEDVRSDDPKGRSHPGVDAAVDTLLRLLGDEAWE